MASRVSYSSVEHAEGFDMEIVGLKEQVLMEWRIAWDREYCFQDQTVPYQATPDILGLVFSHELFGSC